MRDLLEDTYIFGFAKGFDDPWIANSLMQKAIRRGDIETAQRAALSFHALRGSAIWRRLLIIAVEDIGIGSPETVIEAVETCTNRALRKANGGNAHVIFNLTRQLAEAIKDRSADHLIIAAAEHPRLEAARRQMASLAPSERLELVADQELPLSVRATAAWFASGLEWDRNRRILGSDFAGLERTYLALGAPSQLVRTAMLTAHRTREPLAVLLPLIWLAVQTEHRNVVCSTLPPTEKIGKLPLYALDMHTRVGRRALDCLSRENTEIRELLRRYAPDRSGIDAVRVAAFYAEAACVASQFVTPTTRHLEALGIEADLLRAGVTPNGHQILINSVRLQLAHLNELRARFLHEARTTA